MRGAIVFLFFVGCGATKSTNAFPLDAGPEGGDDAGDTRSDAGTDAGCAPLAKKQGVVQCISDSDCPPAPNAPAFCCAMTEPPAPPVCEFAPITETICEYGGCVDDQVQKCDGTNDIPLDRHLCAAELDCRTEQRCCSICTSGFTVSVCLQPAEAAKFGAQCM
jgi:hypothetical protein